MKVLLVKLSSLGDVVHAMPAVQDIRRALPEARIDWVVEPAFADLVRRCEGVTKVIACDQRRWRRAPFAPETRAAFAAFRAELQSEAYDRVIDLQGLTKSALVAWLARLAPGGRKVALGNRTAGSGYEAPTRWVAQQAVYIPPRIHAVDRARVLCAHALDYAPQGEERFGLRASANAANAAEGDGAAGLARSTGSMAPVATLTPGDAVSGEVAFVHGPSRADKLWPEARWIELGRALIARGLVIGLPHGSEEERVRAERLAQALGPQARLWPRLPLGELADRLSACAGVIGVDSGLSHIATALDLPHVQIYNHDTAWRTGPVNRTRQVSVFAKPHPALDAVLIAWDRVSAKGVAL